MDCLIEFAKSINADGILINGNHIELSSFESVSKHGDFYFLIINK